MSLPSSPALRDFFETFRGVAGLPRGYWLVVGAFVFESMAYFGVLTLMSPFLSSDLGWGDVWAGLTVSVFTMLVTLFMLGVGSLAEGFGLRRAILFALAISTVGRVAYSLAAGVGGGALAVVAGLGGLMIVALGSGILQPVCYSGIKQYTDAKTSSMGYALIYAIMNLCIVGVGAISSWLRPAVETLRAGGTADPVAVFFQRFSGTGVQAVNWACVGITALTLVAFWVTMTKRVEAVKLRPDTAEAERKAETRSLRERWRVFFADGPFGNRRFVFFIFILLPVRTLFAHQWLTFPSYILRSYDTQVADRMEWLVNWINPAIIFLAVPLVTAFTRRVEVYRMMMIGTLVSALPTFLLCAGPDLKLLIMYFVIFSIGEALWSARFLEYASELAPPGRVAQYMGLANIPWLLAKGTTGLYSGWMLSHYCPAEVPRAELETGGMWFIYGCIAMISPLGLWLARGWVMSGLHPRNETPAAG